VHIDLDQATERRSFHATVCIIGGGIAGLILAMRLARSGVDVHLLEGGGLEFEQRSQDLYRAEMTAGNHRGSNDGRFRTYGGSSTQWGGQILPFTPDIFDPPAGSPSLRWPVGEQELTPYYDEIQSILGVDPLPFTADLLPALGHSAPTASHDVRLRFAKWTPFKKRNLAQTVGAEALAHSSVTVFTHANAATLSVDADDPRRIQSIRVLNHESQEFTFTAAHFVLCAGTVECSRLLLCSPSIPNPHDQIGRYFHDHVAYHAAMRIDSPARERIIDLFGPFYVDGTIHSCKFEATPELRARDAFFAVMAHVVVLEPDDSGTAAIRNLLRSLQSGRIKEAIGTNLLPMLRGGGDVLRLVLYARFKRRRAVSKRAELRINIDVEQSPNPDNRIRLSSEKIDVLGLPITVIDWSIGIPEQDTAARYAYVIQDYLRALGLTSIEWNECVLNHTTPPLLDTNHAMGGLRMGHDPASSVVDTNLTFHGIDNLHVASCAVFPSGSSSNPTFTMMALTLRLADRLISLISSATASTSPQHTTLPAADPAPHR
jgi:choline dehydrogenase-like flavoprotein